jgi:hypothetical protein
MILIRGEIAAYGMFDQLTLFGEPTQTSGCFYRGNSAFQGIFKHFLIS